MKQNHGYSSLKLPNAQEQNVSPRVVPVTPLRNCCALRPQIQQQHQYSDICCRPHNALGEIRYHFNMTAAREPTVNQWFASFMPKGTSVCNQNPASIQRHLSPPLCTTFFEELISHGCSVSEYVARRYHAATARRLCGSCTHVTSTAESLPSAARVVGWSFHGPLSKARTCWCPAPKQGFGNNGRCSLRVHDLCGGRNNGDAVMDGLVSKTTWRSEDSVGGAELSPCTCLP